MHTFVLKFFSHWKNVLLMSILLGGLLVLLLLPTMKSLRTVEVNPENKGFVVGANQPLARNIKTPAGHIDYVILWIIDGHENNWIAPSDYATLQLDVSSAADEKTVHTANNPSYTIREGKPALVFHIQRLSTRSGERYNFDLEQTRNSTVRLQLPLTAQIKEGETALAAFQLAQQKNWITSLIDRVYAENLIGNDISMYLHRGQQITKGINPYACVLEKGSCIGYPAHTPGMYVVASAFVLLGVHDLDSWTTAWRPVAIASWLAVGIVLLVHLSRKGYVALAVAATGFLLFNRWSLDVLRIAHTDFLGVLFLLLAVIMVDKKPKTAAVILGVSLAIKQMAILIIPLFLLFAWRKMPKKISQLALITGLVAFIPLLTLAPFLIDDAPATLQGVLNPIERPAQQVHGFASSFSQSLDVTDISKIFLMVYLIGIVYLAAYQKTINLAGGTLMVFVIMLSFTHVLYNQYIVWMLPFIPLAIAYHKNNNS